MHPVQQLRQALDFVRDDSPMRPIREWIPGRAFFPGGAGLFFATRENPLPPMPQRPIMFVGHNFDSETSYAESLKRGEELVGEGTWKGLLALLTDAHINPHDCYFTNAIMGLFPGSQSVGDSPGFLDAEFRSRCAEYLRFQISVVKPRAVITMGLQAFQVFREACAVFLGMHHSLDWKSIDAAGHQFAAKIELESQAFSFAAMVHPSYRARNVRVRSFEGKIGKDAETELLRRSCLP